MKIVMMVGRFDFLHRIKLYILRHDCGISGWSYLFDVVKELLRIKARFELEHEFAKARTIHELLDDLGKHLEDVLFRDDW